MTPNKMKKKSSRKTKKFYENSIIVEIGFLCFIFENCHF